MKRADSPHFNNRPVFPRASPWADITRTFGPETVAPIKSPKPTRSFPRAMGRTEHPGQPKLNNWDCSSFVTFVFFCEPIASLHSAYCQLEMEILGSSARFPSQAKSFASVGSSNAAFCVSFFRSYRNCNLPFPFPLSPLRKLTSALIPRELFPIRITT